MTTPDVLSTRERQIVALLSEGLTHKEIGARLGRSRKTINNHVTNIYGKVGVDCRVRLVVWAIAVGVIPQPTGTKPH